MSVGVQHGPLRPDWGERWADLQCDECDATWTGPIGEHCSYCIVIAEDMRRWQTELTLTPPDVNTDNTQYRQRMEAWAARLANAVKAGNITEHQADTAWRRNAHAA